LDVAAHADLIQGVVDHYWQDGGKKKWTEVAKYFVKNRREPTKGFITFLVDHTVDNNDFVNIEYILPYIFNEIDTYLASPKYRKSADPRKE
jgi:hypothetical protein